MQHAMNVMCIAKWKSFEANFAVCTLLNESPHCKLNFFIIWFFFFLYAHALCFSVSLHFPVFFLTHRITIVYVVVWLSAANDLLRYFILSFFFFIPSFSFPIPFKLFVCLTTLSIMHAIVNCCTADVEATLMDNDIVNETQKT